MLEENAQVCPLTSAHTHKHMCIRTGTHQNIYTHLYKWRDKKKKSSWEEFDQIRPPGATEKSIERFSKWVSSR